MMSRGEHDSGYIGRHMRNSVPARGGHMLDHRYRERDRPARLGGEYGSNQAFPDTEVLDLRCSRGGEFKQLVKAPCSDHPSDLVFALCGVYTDVGSPIP